MALTKEKQLGSIIKKIEGLMKANWFGLLQLNFESGNVTHLKQTDTLILTDDDEGTTQQGGYELKLLRKENADLKAENKMLKGKK